MHGRPRQRVHDPVAVEADRSKAKSLDELLSRVLKNHHDRRYTKEALDECSQLLELNPEVYTAWNFQKLALKHLLDAEPDKEAQKKLVQEDLKVNEKALTTNIKSYGAWHHRKWLMNMGLSSLEHEFGLLSMLFRLDPRNFHAWAYRRHIVALKNATIDSELKFTDQIIDMNFSNYSAWHNRSALLTKVFEDNHGEKSNEEILNEEFSKVTRAFFIDPNDQSAWIYHTWLLAKSKQLDPNWKHRLSEEIEMCRELLEMEKKDCKYAMLTLARMLMAESSSEHANEVTKIFEELVHLDPTHREYYRDMQLRT